MSYCVNCGVELEQSLERCPLCNTPVINPNEVTHTHSVPPFPKEKGQVEVVKSRDLAILLSVSLSAASIVCGLLNLFVFQRTLWSLYVIGACVVIWVLAIPAIIYTKMPIYISLICDGLAIGLYQYMISFNTANHDWFFKLALPITALVTVAALLFTLFLQKVSSAFLMTALYFFVDLAFLCVGIELLIERFLEVGYHLTWSAVVLSICAVIVIALVTILSRARLRNAVRRRLHF
ncbi:MAG: DUF6320 domain-containing protein [Eubacteriales bacterium]|nr:DUF6320 domain-containing protein [Eubacteriales bacterium]